MGNYQSIKLSPLLAKSIAFKECGINKSNTTKISMKNKARGLKKEEE
jgi:hypothetical protein